MTDPSHAAPAGDRNDGLTPELLPCPFCGSDAAEETIIDKNEGVAYTPWYQAVCRRCDFWLPGSWDEAEAIARWNRRAGSLSSGETPAEPTPDFRAAAMDMGLALGTLGRIIAPGQDWDGDGRPRDQQIRDLIAAAKKLAGSAPPATEPGDAPSEGVEELTEIIWWLLGERDEFPSPPNDLSDVIACGRKELRRPGIEDKPIRLYWWRGALRGRFDNWARNYHERQARRASRAGGTAV